MKPYPKISLSDLKEALSHNIQIIDKNKQKPQSEKLTKTLIKELVIVTR